eukprot:scaffold145271_cov50-Attheya_sp.AAC.3
MAALPPTKGGTTTPPTGSASTTDGGDWKKSLSQSYRSAEVRAVAKVLAALEPGATSSSKLMLAMRFEENIFDSAASLADYRKRLTKRLKKLQKSYKPPPVAATTTPTSSTANAAELAVEAELRERFRDQLLFIAEHAKEATDILTERQGPEKSHQLRQHIDNAEQWAVEIGIQSPQYLAHRSKRVPREPNYLDRLRGHLETRVDNIRSHVVKLTSPDLFLEETLLKLEQDLDGPTHVLLADVAKTLFGKAGLAVHPPDTVKTLLERAMRPVPALRAGYEPDVAAAFLAHIDKIRAASQALVSYIHLGEEGNLHVPALLQKSHKVAVQGIGHIAETFTGKNNGNVEETVVVKLEDAWNKVIEYIDPSERSSTATVEDSIDVDVSIPPTGSSDTVDDLSGAEPSPKRLKTNHNTARRKGIVIRTKVLLTPGRKAPFNLLQALRSKQAQLIRPKNDVGTRLILKFGDAFEMIIYFIPLLVILRALPQNDDTRTSSTHSQLLTDESEFCTGVVNGSLPTWIPSQYGLNTHKEISVLGMKGSHSTVGRIVSEKLQHSSSLATRVLRRCFADMTYKAYSNPSCSDFEVEISEATALLTFLQLARTTFIPNWQDVDPS